MSYNNLSEKIYHLLNGFKYNFVMFDDNGRSTTHPKKANVFFSNDPNFMVTIFNERDEQRIVLNKTPTMSIEVSKDLIKVLKRFAHEEHMSFTTKNFAASIKPKDHSFNFRENIDLEILNDILTEAFVKLPGKLKTSYQQFEQVVVKLKHTKPVDENVRGARSRNIHSIFIECNGNSYKFPHKNVSAAKAMARHISAGGLPDDQIGTYIIESCEKYQKLQAFCKYIKHNNLINEDSSLSYDMVIESMHHLRSTFDKLSGKKTYDMAISSITESGTDVECDISDIREMFTVKYFDESFSDILPMVKTSLNEKNAYYNKLQESFSNGISVKRYKSGAKLFTFESKHKKLAFQLKELSENINGNDQLSSFLIEIATKLNKNQKLNLADHKIIKYVVENAVEYDTFSESEIISYIVESKEFEFDINNMK